jgi:hypothetical protein
MNKRIAQLLHRDQTIGHSYLQARHPLHEALSQADPLHHRFPLYRQVTLMQNW